MSNLYEPAAKLADKTGNSLLFKAERQTTGHLYLQNISFYNIEVDFIGNRHAEKF